MFIHCFTFCILQKCSNGASTVYLAHNKVLQCTYNIHFPVCIALPPFIRATLRHYYATTWQQRICNVRRIKHINSQSHHLSVILYLIFLRQLRYVGHFPDSKGLYTPHTILHQQQITSPWLANSKYTPNKAHDWSHYVT